MSERIPVGATVYSWVNLPEIVTLKGVVLAHRKVAGGVSYSCKWWRPDLKEWHHDSLMCPFTSRKDAQSAAEAMETIIQKNAEKYRS